MLPYGLVLASILVGLAVIDVRRRILPDELNLLLGLSGIVQSLVTGQPALIDAALGSALCGGILISVALLFRRIRGIEGLGLGDQKLGAAAGFWIGWQQVPMMLSFAALSALFFIALRALWTHHLNRMEILPFGPFLSAGIFVAWLIGVAQ